MIESLLSKLLISGVQVSSISQRAEDPNWWGCELIHLRHDGRICHGYGNGPSAYYALLAAQQHLEAETSALAENLKLHYSFSPQKSSTAEKRAGEALLAKLGLGKAKPQVSIL